MPTLSSHSPPGWAVNSTGQMWGRELFKGWITQKARAGEEQVFVGCFGGISTHTVINRGEDIKSLNQQVTLKDTYTWPRKASSVPLDTTGSVQNYEVIKFWQPHSLLIFYHFPQHRIPSLPEGTTSAVNNNSTFPPNFLLKKNHPWESIRYQSFTP